MLINVPQRKESMITSVLKQNNNKKPLPNKTTLVGHKHHEQGKGPPGVPSPVSQKPRISEAHFIPDFLVED